MTEVYIATNFLLALSAHPGDKGLLYDVGYGLVCNGRGEDNAILFDQPLENLWLHERKIWQRTAFFTAFPAEFFECFVGYEGINDPQVPCPHEGAYLIY